MATGLPPIPHQTPAVSANTTHASSIVFNLGTSTHPTVIVNHNYTQVIAPLTIGQVVGRLIEHIESTVPDSADRQTLLDQLRTVATHGLSVATRIPDLIKLFNVVTGTDIPGI